MNKKFLMMTLDVKCVLNPAVTQPTDTFVVLFEGLYKTISIKMNIVNVS